MPLDFLMLDWSRSAGTALEDDDLYGLKEKSTMRGKERCNLGEAERRDIRFIMRDSDGVDVAGCRGLLWLLSKGGLKEQKARVNTLMSLSLSSA
jgi:hypothetical protein